MELLQNKKDYCKTLRFVSRDTQNGLSLIEAEDIVFDFDGITKYLCDRFYSRQTLASCDAFLQRDNEYYLMEFKNREAQRIRPGEIEKKAFMSFNLLRLEMDQTVSVEDACDHATLFVIFRDDVPVQAPVDREKAMDQETSADIPRPEAERVSERSAGSDSYRALVEKVKQLAKIEETDPILFGLRKMKDKFYHQIYTIPKSEFMDKWYPQLFPGT